MAFVFAVTSALTQQRLALVPASSSSWDLPVQVSVVIQPTQSLIKVHPIPGPVRSGQWEEDGSWRYLGLSLLHPFEKGV